MCQTATGQAVGHIGRGLGRAGDLAHQLVLVKVEGISSVGQIVTGHTVGWIDSGHGGAGNAALLLPPTNQIADSLPLG